MDMSTQTARWFWRGKDLVEDSPCFGLHRAPVMCRPHAQACLSLVIKASNTQRSHGHHPTAANDLNASIAEPA